jgi:transcriptional regulator with XRE-family HTH domain
MELAAAIGARAKQHRNAYGATLDEVAKEARALGLRWTSSRAGDFEGGRISPTLPTLIGACGAYGSATGVPLTLASLIPDGKIEVTPVLSLSGERIASFLDGEPVEIFAGDVYTDEEIQETFRRVIADITNIPPRYKKIPLETLREVQQGSGIATGRVVYELGESFATVHAAAAKLWGRSLEAQRDLLAGPDANAQKRGHVMRTLKQELREELEAAKHVDD